jgi:hypothetical protein
MSCDTGMWIAVGINMASLIANIALSIRAIRSWNRANDLIDRNIKLRAQMIREAFKRQ